MKAKFGDLDNRMPRLRALEDENAKLKELLAETMLDIAVFEGHQSPKVVKPAARRQNGYVESFKRPAQGRVADGEIFYSLREAQIAIESRRRHYNTVRPHQSLGYRPPAPEVFVPTPPRSAPPATLPLAFKSTLN